MKHRSSHHSPSPKAGRDRTRGAAVVVVLGLTLLMAVLVLSVMNLAVVEKRSASSAAAALGSDALVQEALALAIGQLREGTRQLAADGTPLPWTSQPGALRVHRLDGSLQSLIKLYSASVMRAGSLDETLADLPADWDQQTGEFVDLNEPSFRPTTASSGEEVAVAWRFPIADPHQRGGEGQPPVEGFDYGAGPLRVGGVVRAQEDANAPKLPMPVRWLYRLQDGTLGTLTPDGRFSAVTGSGRPSRDNPAVGRLAFWTDDESCKINVNTASEGVFWDAPRCTTREELTMASKQPAAGEYQRFPGHPAMVCLSSVLFPGQRFHADGSASADRVDHTRMNDLDPQLAERLWSISPVLTGMLERTTRGGRVQVPGLDSAQPWPVFSDATSRVADPQDLIWGGAAKVPAFGSRSIDPLFVMRPDAIDRLSRGGFFLTTCSSAPEATLFGTPRVSLWPIHENVVPGEGVRGPVARGSAHDAMMALTTTLAGRRYHWQRAAPGDGHLNFFATATGRNRELFEYAQAMTARPVPGFVRAGQASSFAEKYGAGRADDRDSILVGIFDYIRQINFNDAGLTPDQQFCVTCPADPQRGFGQVSPLFAGGNAKTRRTDQLQAADLHAAKGMGRMLTISEVAFVFSCLAEVDETGRLHGEPSSEAVARRMTRPGMREIQMAVVLEGFVPSQGWGEYRPYLTLGLGGRPARATDALGPMPGLQLFEETMGLTTPSPANGPTASPPFAMLKTSDDLAALWVPSGGAAGVRFASAGGRLSTVFTFKSVVAGAGVEHLNFSGSPLGQPLQLAVFDTPEQDTGEPWDDQLGAVATSDLVQVMPLKVPPLTGSLVIPRLPADGTPIAWEKRMAAAKTGGRLISSADVVQSLVPAHGDHRLIAASRTLDRPPGIPDSEETAAVWVPHPGWGQAAHAHALGESTPEARAAVLGGLDERPVLGYHPDLPMASFAAPDFPWWDAVAGEARLISRAGRSAAVDLPVRIDAGRLDRGRRGVSWPHLTGDFDNGLAWATDGPYINRPDDGETSGYSAGGVPYFDLLPPRPMHLPEARPRLWGAQRQVPSPVMLGSLPTGVKARVPWQTLLFRPQGELDPARWQSTDGHYGWSWPRDHLLLDLLWMPVQEPAALSSPMATEGKINMNHPLVPFRHVRRATALHALLKAEKLLAIPDRASLTYKLPPGSPPRHHSFRHFIDATATLAQWDEEVFARGDVFLSASQVCEHDLVPEGETGDRAAMRAFWSRHRLTGDNSKERPYAHIYSRLTTRSNVYRIHFKVETIRSSPPDAAGRLDPASLETLASQEGSAVVERSLDPAHPDLPDAVAVMRAGNLPPPLDHFHEWRIRRIDHFVR